MKFGGGSGRTNTLLLSILGVALVLRVVGVWHGLPFPLCSDEESLIGGALRMLELRSLIPAFHPQEMAILNYPPVIPYVYLTVFVPYLGLLYAVAGFPEIAEFSLTVFEHIGEIFLLARLTSVAFGVATVLVVYRLGCEMLKSRFAGLAASAFLSVDFVSSFTGHFARHWNLTTLIVWFSVLLAWRIYEHRRRRDYVLLGVAGGLGFGVSYSFGCVGLAAGLVAHLFAKGLRRAVDVNIALTAVVFLGLAVAFFAVHPNAVLRLIVGGVAGLDEPKSVAGWIAAAAFYGRAFWYANPMLVIAAMLGIGVALCQRQYVLAVGAIAALVFLVTLLYVTVALEGRYIILAVPVLTLLAGYGFAELLSLSRSRYPARFGVTVGMAVCLAIPFTVSAQASWMLARSDTRELALKWIDANIWEGERIVFDVHAIWLRATLESLSEQRGRSASSLTAYDRARLRSGEHSGGATDAKEYHVLNLSRFVGDDFEAVHEAANLGDFRERGYRYFIGQYRDHNDLTPLFKAVQDGGRLLARFDASEGDRQPPYLRSTVLLPYPMHHLLGMERFGPTVEIYDITVPASETLPPP